MYDKRLMSQSHFNNANLQMRFGIRVCLTKLKIRASYEAEQYRVIDHTIDDSEVNEWPLLKPQSSPIQSSEH